MAEAGASLGTRLRRIRERRGLKPRDLALLSGVSASTISELESGQRTDLRGAGLRKLADALSVSVDWLLGRTDKETWDPDDVGTCMIRIWQHVMHVPKR